MVEHYDTPTTAAQDERRAESRWAAADNAYIIGGHSRLDSYCDHAISVFGTGSVTSALRCAASSFSSDLTAFSSRSWPAISLVAWPAVCSTCASGSSTYSHCSPFSHGPLPLFQGPRASSLPF